MTVDLTTVTSTSTTSLASTVTKHKCSCSSDNIWNVAPLYHTPHYLVRYKAPDEDKKTPVPKNVTFDSFTPLHNYLTVLSSEVVSASSKAKDFPELPLLHTWLHFMEGYHNHFARFRGRDRIIFMEIGVQSGGKIPMLRDYFGPGFQYVGVDINKSTKMFETAPWITIEIGDSGNALFLKELKRKHPMIDIFLDDGGHTMQQQMTAIEHMLPHVQPEGVYICEDLATSWNKEKYNGVPFGSSLDPEFVNSTMVGLIHQTLDWFQAGWLRGVVNSPMKLEEIPNSLFSNSWWKIIPQQVKHIHYYNQMIVYEKGLTFTADHLHTVGHQIPVKKLVRKGHKFYRKVDWDVIMRKLQSFTNSPWNWTEVK